MSRPNGSAAADAFGQDDDDTQLDETFPPFALGRTNIPIVMSVRPIWSFLRTALYPRAFGIVTMTQGAMDFFPRWMRRREWVIPNSVLLIPPVQRRAGFDLFLLAFARIYNSFE